jgi:hypothetical protein
MTNKSERNVTRVKRQKQGSKEHRAIFEKNATEMNWLLEQIQGKGVFTTAHGSFRLRSTWDNVLAVTTWEMLKVDPANPDAEPEEIVFNTYWALPQWRQ